MGDVPLQMWAQETATGWEDVLATIYKVDHFHKYFHEDLVDHLIAESVKAERDRCANAIMNADLQDHYDQGGRIHFDDLQEFFAAAMGEPE